MSESSNEPLSSRLARGEEAAFTALYDDCADRLHCYLVGRLGTADMAGDVLQATFLRVVKSRRKFRVVVNPAAYVFQIARNEAARAATRQANLQRKEQSLPAADQFAARVNADARSDDREMILRALARLTATDREVVELRIYGGLTFREIADLTQLPMGTVTTRYRRSLESLRAWLTKQYR